ncbi:phosphoglycerate dehydrogenase [Okeania sp. SIO2B3]|uniref:phosphoglycerate dehydrogenase n=1 Tax=Okeania sp. SIO2B3 TaxID=2607784 RepID=UPI0013C0DFCB|nr:phosphoglycerate dehydrogenase [Okeania sp. SIO2B3]NET41047.1 phosphoglycerate dehydrogenase [Okeania sp. SIO2B3]
MKWRILITCPHLQKTIDPYRPLFAERNVEIEVPTLVQQLSEAELLEIIDRFDGVIAGDDFFTAKVLEKGKRLKIVAKWGIGLDAIDLEAAKKLGILVHNTPDVFADEVADVVLGYIVLLARRLHKLDHSVRNGGWLKVQGRSLRGKTLGVIGVGSIGRAVVRRGVALGMSVVGYDVASVPESFIQDTGMSQQSLESLLQVSDFISLNCNLTSDNRHLLGQKQFDLMKEGVYLINTARGPLVDEAALVKALAEGKVAGAALDVFEEEPLPMDSPLRQFDNCIFGTHNASNTLEAVMRVNEMAIQNLLEGLEGSIR